ncbi:copper chaperone PCu(A)C [Xanthobacter sediminis]
MSNSIETVRRARRTGFSFKGIFTAAALALGALSMSVPPAAAHEYKAGAIEIGHPWARATPGGASVGGGYLTLKNTGATPDRLVSVAVPFAGRAEIHEMATADGVMTMRPLPDGIALPPGGSVALKPGALHIMFMDLKEPLKEGAMVDGTLTFEKAGTVPVKFKVEGLGAGAPAPAHEHTGH